MKLWEKRPRPGEPDHVPKVMSESPRIHRGWLAVVVLGLLASWIFSFLLIGFDFQTFYEIGLRAQERTLPMAIEMLKNGLVYLPFFALWMMALTALPWMIAFMLWNAVKWFCYSVLFRWHARSTPADFTARHPRLSILWLLLPWILFLPSWSNELKLGQVNIFLVTLVAGTFCFLEEGRENAAALCYAVSSFKLIPVFCLPYFILRKRWSFLLKTTALVGLLALSVIFWWGIEGSQTLMREWIANTSWRQIRPEFFFLYNDQSLLSMFMRALYPRGVTVETIHHLTSAVSLSLLGISLWVLRRPESPAGPFPGSDVAIFLTVMSLASPNQAVSHRVFLMVPLIYVMRKCLEPGAGKTAWAAFALFIPFMLEGSDLIGSRLFQALHQRPVYTLIMLAIWTLLLRLSREENRA